MSGYFKRRTWIVAALLGCLMFASTAQAASFDCAKAQTKVEKLICDNAEISKQDEEMAASYKDGLQDDMQAKSVEYTQKQWLKGRNACTNAACVKESYEKRLFALSHSYTLLMSKNEKLCNEMLDLYNEDRKAYKRIRYDQHEMFTAIQWQVDDERFFTSHAFFDINNDGKDELVFKRIWHLRGNEIENIYIHMARSDVFSRLKSGVSGEQKIYDTSNQLFSSGNQMYFLKALPETSEAWVGGLFVLQPFIWEGESFISMTDQTPRWIVIAQYKQAEEMQDICYFFNPNIKHQLY